MPTWHVGSETDDLLLEALRLALEAEGFTARTKSWGVAGSQEVIEVDFESSAGTVRLTSETYEGVTLSGPSEILNLLRTRIAVREGG